MLQAHGSLNLRSVRLRRDPSRLICYCFAVLVVLVVTGPLLYMALVAVQTSTAAGTQVIPSPWHWSTFAQVWQVVDLTTYLRNSILVATGTAVCSSILGFGAAYVIARFPFRLRGPFRLTLLASYTTPGLVLLLPLYIVYNGIQAAIGVQIVGSLYLLVITYMTFSLPLAIWILSGYVTSLPVELEEQASVDGARRLATLRYVVLPLALPGVVVSFIFAFLRAWNDVLFASVLTNQSTRTVGMGLEYFVSTTADTGLPQWNQLMAASLISSVPAAVMFLIVQRYLVHGLAAGAVKS